MITTLSDWVPVYVGMGFAFAAVSLGVWLKNRRRKQLGESPPDTAKLLRPPGFWLQQQLEKIQDDLLTTMLHVVGSSVVAALMVTPSYRVVAEIRRTKPTFAQLMSIPKAWVIPLGLACAIVCVLWVGWSLRRLFVLVEKGRSYRLGLRGEMATAEALHSTELAAAGYTVFHDVPGDGQWNIDHLVVGPAGVFVIETKTRHRRNPTRNQRGHEVSFDGQTLYFPWCEDHDAISQARRLANWVRKQIEDISPKGIRVEPIVALPGRWFVRGLDKNHPKLAMNSKYLADYIRGQPPVYKAEQLHGVVGSFRQRCRTVEF